MVKIKQYIGVAILCFVSSYFASAQQEAMFSHYAFNTLNVNPAYAGSRDVLTVTGLHRSQWVNFPGAPITQTVTVHSPVFSEKLGVGLSLINDKIGPTSSSSAFVDFSYKLKLGNGNLAFGLKGGLSFRSDKLADITTEIGDDPLFEQDIRSIILPNFGFGVYYSTPKYFIGISTPRILENEYAIANTNAKISVNDRHYYVIAGAILNLSKTKNIKLQPTVYVKSVAGAPLGVDITTLVYFNDRFWVGPMFRFGDAAGMLLGANITDQFALSYGYDWSFANSSSRYNAGSHELMLRYDFVFNSKEKIESPRYF